MLRVGGRLPTCATRIRIRPQSLPFHSFRATSSSTMTTASTTSSPKRGALIVVEGLDRAGKTVQCTTIQKLLGQKGHLAKYARFPDRTTATGSIINTYLKGELEFDDHAIHLLFSTNRWEAISKIKSDIAAGATTIMDRYSYSGAVYSAAKNNPDLSLDWAWNPEVGLPKPDLLIYLDIPLEEAAKRGGYGQERYENAQLQSRAQVLFRQLIDAEDQNHVFMIDAAQEQQKVTDIMMQVVEETIAKTNLIGPLRKLGFRSQPREQ